MAQTFSYEGVPTTKGYSAARVQIQAFAKAYTAHFQKKIAQYNDNTNNVDYFISKIKDKDQAVFLKDLIQQNKVRKLPKIEFKNGLYYMRAGNDIMTFDITSAMQGKVYLNNKELNLKKIKNIKELTKKISLTVAQTKTSYLNFLLPEANAFICGGFCVAALVGTVVVGGIIVGKKAMDMFAEDDEMEVLRAMRERIKNKSHKCNQDLNEVSEYTGKLNTYDDISPGNFDTFELYQKTLNVTTEINERKVEEHLIQIMKESMGDDAPNLDNLSCEEFAEKFYNGLDIGAKRVTFKSDIEGEVCTEYRGLASCLTRFHNIHRTHINSSGRGKKNIYNYQYNPESGVYDGGYSK